MREMFGKWITILEKVNREGQPNSLEHTESRKQTKLVHEPEAEAGPQRVREPQTEQTLAPVTTHTVEENPSDPNPEVDSQTLPVLQPPTLKDYNVPETDEELLRMVEMMIRC